MFPFCSSFTSSFFSQASTLPSRLLVGVGWLSLLFIYLCPNLEVPNPTLISLSPSAYLYLPSILILTVDCDCDCYYRFGYLCPPGSSLLLIYTHIHSYDH
ncbi:hypothetical protein BJX68DRAFT_228091 [Aspergillus pseudodeflectus]|uniref:Uncharacterized protein n=1 Tax=Aspergillus pseudodeflectus TaxID=176178 RepID=A0ABR4L0Y3_9EURO